jgi:hypothetical protein
LNSLLKGDRKWKDGGGSIAVAPGRVISSRVEMFLEKTPRFQQKTVTIPL